MLSSPLLGCRRLLSQKHSLKRIKTKPPLMGIDLPLLTVDVCGSCHMSHAGCVVAGRNTVSYPGQRKALFDAVAARGCIFMLRLKPGITMCTFSDVLRRSAGSGLRGFRNICHVLSVAANGITVIFLKKKHTD